MKIAYGKGINAKLSWHLLVSSFYVLVLLVASIVGGLIASTGNVALVVLLSVLLIGLAMAFSRLVLFWFVVVGGIIVTGLAQLYFPSMQYVRWIVGLAGGGLFAHLLFWLAFTPRDSRSDARVSSLLHIEYLLIAFFVLSLASSFIHIPELKSLIVGVKNYYQVWGVFFSLAFIGWSLKFINSIPKALIWFSVLQLPFVLQQYIFIVPYRNAVGMGTAEDVIAGTFGASMLGGGANAVLSAFLFMTMAIVLSLWKKRQLSGARAAVLLSIMMLPIVVNLSKISIIYALIVYLVVFGKDVIQKPLRFMAVGCGTALALAGLLSIYVADQGADSLSEFFDNAYSSQLGEEMTKNDWRLLNRRTALTFWAEEHALDDSLDMFIGHGLGASRDSGFSDTPRTLAEHEYKGVGIGITGVSALLWDTGLLGTGIIFCVFFFAFLQAGKLEKIYAEDKEKVACFLGIKAGVVIFFVSLFHKDHFVYHLGYQTILMLIFGYICYMTRHKTKAP